MSIRYSLRAFAACAVFLAVTMPVAAAPIIGNFNTSGSVIVSLSTIDWVGDAFTVGAGTGYFSLFGSTAGVIQDLNSVAQPVGAPFLYTSFMTFAVDPNLRVDLTFINPGIFSSAACGAVPAAGQTCTPTLPPGFGVSPFNLTNLTAGSATVSFSVRGTATNTLTGDISLLTGTFSASFDNEPYQQILADLSTLGSVRSTYSGSFTATPIPEPGTISMMLAGLSLLSVRFLRRR